MPHFRIAVPRAAGSESGVALNVLIVPDKFKGTLTAHQAVQAIARGWSRVRPDDTLDFLPMSDGGDGFGEVMGSLLQAEVRQTRTVDAAHRPIEASWRWCPGSSTAIIESARVVGLAMLPKGKYHPFELDTYGLGAVLKEAAATGVRRCLVGIGGSATNDAGFGLARALGWQFHNDHEETICRWTQLNHLASIRPPTHPRLFEELVVAVDVQNPLLGPQGCSRVYGPQKGLTEFEFAEACLARLSSIWEREFRQNYAAVPGAGAAGGLGFGLMSFLGGTFRPGFELFAEAAALDERIRKAHLVLTGEGALDTQTVMGKGVGEIALACRRANVPCLGLAGIVPDPAAAAQLFTGTFALTHLTDQESALREPARWLEQLASQVASSWKG
jgi:glycerate kinase